MPETTVKETATDPKAAADTSEQQTGKSAAEPEVTAKANTETVKEEPKKEEEKPAEQEAPKADVEIEKEEAEVVEATSGNYSSKGLVLLKGEMRTVQSVEAVKASFPDNPAKQYENIKGGFFKRGQKASGTGEKLEPNSSAFNFSIPVKMDEAEAVGAPKWAKIKVDNQTGNPQIDNALSKLKTQEGYFEASKIKPVNYSALPLYRKIGTSEKATDAIGGAVGDMFKDKTTGVESTATISKGVAGGGSAGSKVAEILNASNASEVGKGFGAAGGIIGGVGALISLKDGAEKISGTTGREKAQGALDVTKSLGEGTKSSANAAQMVSELVNNGSAATGAQIAAAGATVALGAVELIRGAYKGVDSHKRIKALELIRDSSKDEEVKKAISVAIFALEKKRTDGAITATKGALMIVGGSLLLAGIAAGPIGAALIGVGLLAVGVYALYKYFKTKKEAKEITLDYLKPNKELRKERDAWKAERDKKKLDYETKTPFTTRKFSSHSTLMKSNENYRDYQELLLRDPMHVELQKNNFKDPKDFYKSYVEGTATVIYNAAVAPPEGKAADPEYTKILEEMGLKVDSQNKQPSIEKIKKRLE